MKRISNRLTKGLLAGLIIVIFMAPVAWAEPVVKEWKIPWLYPATGVYSGFGTVLNDAVVDTVAQINATGGIAGRPLVPNQV